ncbi:cytochrome C oxidase subunit IV family protein [Mycobacterium barrassiae]|uniref:cytochrome C oxidase subunit IV family protein n=1 Tax=Mycobacterium barrassiae TaxID=319709 RepID=UPI002265C1CD|nr:cytochrome C oxidase subunit IV family protein [Mycobacterium barrassiae]MCV7301270.1 cytochrome C oxidase subunit IV family protein [Mycobacterium barrassiae]
MNVLLRSRATLVWLLLVAATALSWGMGHDVGISDMRIAGVAIIVVAFVKVRFVVFEFMEIRGAPKWMRQVGEGWIVLIATLLIARILIQV